MNNFSFNSWDKLILLLIVLGIILYLHSILTTKGANILKAQTPAANTQTIATPTQTPTLAPQTPTPTIIKSIRGINGGEGFDN